MFNDLRVIFWKEAVEFARGVHSATNLPLIFINNYFRKDGRKMELFGSIELGSVEPIFFTPESIISGGASEHLVGIRHTLSLPKKYMSAIQSLPLPWAYGSSSPLILKCSLHTGTCIDEYQKVIAPHQIDIFYSDYYNECKYDIAVQMNFVESVIPENCSQAILKLENLIAEMHDYDVIAGMLFCEIHSLSAYIEESKPAILATSPRGRMCVCNIPFRILHRFCTYASISGNTYSRAECPIIAIIRRNSSLGDQEIQFIKFCTKPYISMRWNSNIPITTLSPFDE